MVDKGNGEFYDENTGYNLEDGIINWVREGENYHGLKIRLTTISDLRIFQSFVK